MKAYVITIGDEILIGNSLNTNAAYIGEQLLEINIPVIKASVVGDDNSAILNELNLASSISDLILITGGLGPTHDDVTRKSIVDFFKTELVESNEVLNDIKAIFEKRKRKVTAVNADQAKVPKVAEVIRNQLGTAPGFWIEKDEKIFVVMPDKTYVGVLPDNIGMRMITFVNGGNEYSACIKAVADNSATVFLKEIKKMARFKNQPSFIHSPTSQQLLTER